MWTSLSGESHWYVRCPISSSAQVRSVFRVQGQLKCQGSQTRWVVWGGLACWVDWDSGRGWRWGPGELEHRYGGRSQWSTRGQCPRLHRWPHATRVVVVVGFLAFACLAAPAVPALHLAWGDRVIVAHHCLPSHCSHLGCGLGARTARIGLRSLGE